MLNWQDTRCKQVAYRNKHASNGHLIDILKFDITKINFQMEIKLHLHKCRDVQQLWTDNFQYFMRNKIFSQLLHVM